jgi:hypothetical protein
MKKISALMEIWETHLIDLLTSKFNIMRKTLVAAINLIRLQAKKTKINPLIELPLKMNMVMN